MMKPLALVATLAFAADALGEAQAAYAKIAGYTATIKVHETKGAQTQDRVYRYEVKKPHHVVTEILDGPGKGSGGTWNGGDTVSGHVGGLLKGIHQNVAIDDARATSLRGDTIPSGTIDEMLAHAKNDGEATETAGTMDGTPVDVVTTKVNAPEKTRGVTREVLYLSKSTHLPVGRDRYEGERLVKSERVLSFVPST